MKATFSNTVDILVKAYLNDTLQHGNCHACAVGNIVAHSCGYTYKPNPNKNEEPKIIYNHAAFYYNNGSPEWIPTWYSFVKRHKELPESIRQVNATGYTSDQLYAIEVAFESALSSSGDIMFNGLMAVVDVLAEMHNVDLSVKESAKLLFVK